MSLHSINAFSASRSLQLNLSISLSSAMRIIFLRGNTTSSSAISINGFLTIPISMPLLDSTTTQSSISTCISLGV